MRRYTLRASIIVFAAAACCLSPALALEGAPVDSAHPSVGYIFGQQTDPSVCHDEVISLCSVTLISPTIAITSGACADAWSNPEEYGYTLTASWISFNGDNPLDCSTAVRVESFHVHPLFDETVIDSPYNIGVVRLASPAPGPPAALPAADSLSGLTRGTDLEIVDVGPERQGNILTFRRRFSPASLLSQEADFQSLLLAGGTVCLGSTEGGGAFFPSSQNLASLGIALTRGCKIGQLLRLDTSTARDFLDDFVTLP